MQRRIRVARRLRYRRRHVRLVYRGRIAVLVVMLVLVGVALGTAAVTGRLGVGAVVAGLIVVAWLGYGMRLRRPVPAGPRGDGPAPPGGAGVREPRRPLPMSPAGSAARPRPDQNESGQATALI